MKTLTIALVAFLALTSVSKALTIELKCFEDRDQVVTQLINDYDEYLSKAYTDKNGVIEFHTSEDGTWSALYTTKKLTCLVGYGENLDKNGEDFKFLRVNFGV